MQPTLVNSVLCHVGDSERTEVTKDRSGCQSYYRRTVEIEIRLADWQNIRRRRLVEMELVRILVRLRARSALICREDRPILGPVTTRPAGRYYGRSRESYQSVRSTSEHDAIGCSVSPSSDAPKTDIWRRHRGI